MPQVADNLHQSVAAIARKDAATLRHDLTVREALDAIRRRGVGEKVIYFYVIDDDNRLAGVLPTRRLLTAPLDQRIAGLMVTRVVTVPHTATVLEACETFAMYRFLALPVVDADRRIVGLFDVGLFTDEVFDIAERERLDELFESIGFRVSQVRDAAPARAFRFRFPWLLATIASGLLCAFLASAYELTLTKTIVLAFFLTLMLGLGESVSIQSMTVTIQSLRALQPTFRWYFRAFRRESVTALLLGGAAGTVVGLIAWLWQGSGMEALTIGASIVLVLLSACFFGLSVPALLHALKLDVKVAAGPITLALTDIFTLLFYFTLAALLL